MARRSKKSKSNPTMLIGLALGGVGLYFLMSEKKASAATPQPVTPSVKTPPGPTPPVKVDPPKVTPPVTTTPPATQPAWKPSPWYQYRDINEALWTIKNVAQYVWEGRVQSAQGVSLVGTIYDRPQTGATSQEVEQRIDAYASTAEAFDEAWASPT